MNKYSATMALIALMAVTSFAGTNSTGEGADRCKSGCKVVYLTVQSGSLPGKRVVQDKYGRCWMDRFVEDATKEPNVTTMRSVSKQVAVSCSKFS